MTYPTIANTWIFRVNQQVPTLGDFDNDCRQAIWACKEELVSTSGWTDANGAPAVQSHPWKVMRSSDQSSVANSDLWTDYTKCRAENGQPHSWAVLNHPVFNPPLVPVGEGNPGLAILLDHNSHYDSEPETMTLACSIHGYDSATGTTSYPPDAIGPADGVNGLAAYRNFWGPAQWIVPYSSGVPYNTVWHTMCTTDGHLWRMVGCVGGSARVFLSVDVLANQQGNVDTVERAYCKNGYMITAFSNSGSRMNNDSLLNNTHTLQARDATSGVWHQLSAHGTALWTIDNNVVDRAGGQLSDITSKWHIDEVQIQGSEYACRGYMGNVPDLWAVSDTIPEGSTMNAGVYAVFGGVLLPWNKSTPLVA